MLAVENLRQSFGSLIVLEELSFSIRSGEFISIVGPSGCGKTVLLRLIAGLLRPSSGKLLVEDEKHHAPRIAYAFQKSPLFPWLSLIENVRICMSGNPLSGDEREKQIFAYFKAAGLKELDFKFYEVFGLFRLAVIIQQIWARYRAGQTTNPAFSGFGIGVNILINRADRLLS